ncbi:winged helix-turn-helix domain-containing tetratricopeptide repeat protein [Luteitalea pratensis]|nr:winged helix-turn-helix domain-containing protein [Luteitalea pratensis]
MSQPGPRASYRLRDVVLDVGAYTLRRDGRVIRLERQPMDLLILLVERRGQLVTRAEIVDALWGQDVFVDVETGVHTAIRKIRQALRDAPDAPTFIETVPGKGYRFVAPVEATAMAAVSPSAAPAGSPVAQVAQELPLLADEVTPGRTRREWVRSVAAVASLLVALAALASFVGWPATRRVGVTEPDAALTIAVLPFELLGGDPANAYLADGLMEDTIASLGRIDPGCITVIGRTSMQAYRRTTKSIAEIGRELGADYLVEGSVRAEGERLRITSRLVRPADQVQVWSQSFDRVVGSTFGIQQELSRSIADQVHIRLSPAASEALDRRHSRNEEAFDQFLRGRAAFHHRTPEGMRDAVAAFQRATELDPEYALAWASLGMSHATRAINADADPRVALRLSREAAQQAVKLDSDLAEAQYTLGYVRWLLEWDWDGAETAFRRATALDPSFGLVHQSLGRLLSQSGRHADANAELRRARELDPLDPVPAAMSSQAAFQARDFRAALELAHRTIAINPGFWYGYQMQAQAEAQLDSTASAMQSVQRAIQLSGRNSKPVSLHGYLLGRNGQAAEARALIASLEAQAAKTYVPPYTMALIQAGLGDRDGVFDWLERAYAVRDVHLIYLPVDVKWDPYRSDPRFASILARCGFTTR